MPGLDQVVVTLILGAMAAYTAAGLCLVRNRRRLGLALFGCGCALNAGIVVVNGLACGHPPLGNMYHVVIVLGIFYLPSCLFLGWRENEGWFPAAFAFTAAVPLAGALFMEREVMWHRPPALQSPWFVPHVLTYMLSYSLAAIAFVLTLTGVVRRRRRGTGDTVCGMASYRVLRLAFPFMTFGLLSGAVWADAAWGTCWSWDPKETWSLITWTLYVIYFHCRRTPTLRACAEPAQILAFLALLATFLLVNLLPRFASVLHSYARGLTPP